MTVRIGVIGMGSVGRGHARRIKRVPAGGRICALGDVNSASAEAVRAEIAPEARIFASGEELIAWGGVDAVLIASWGSTHERYVLAAIAAGKPCFCGTPIADTAEGARRIVAAETAGGRRLVQVGFMRRYDAGYIALKHAVENRIGAPIMIHAARRDSATPDRYATATTVNDTLIHEIDVFRWLLDDEFVSARAILPRAADRAHADLRDPHVVIIETARGVAVNVEIFVNCHHDYDIQCEVVGENGTARLLDPMAVEMRLGAEPRAPILTDWKDRFIASYDVQLDDFLRAAVRGTAAGPTAWDGLAAAIVSDACVAAQEAGGEAVPIDLPPRPALYG